MYDRFLVEWEGVLPGDPRQVWEAITRRGSAWVWPIEYEPRLGGAERGLTSVGGTVTAWEPPHRFQTSAEGPDGWANQLDYGLAPHPAGTLLRYSHRGSAEAGSLPRVHEACERHTDFYLHSMGQYVRYFAGREAAYVGVDAEASFAQVRDRLGLPVDVAVGDSVRLEAAGIAAIEGTVDYLAPAFLGVRGDDLLFRVYGRDVWDDPIGIALHLFGGEVDLPAAEQALRQWMTPAREVA